MKRGLTYPENVTPILPEKYVYGVHTHAMGQSMSSPSLIGDVGRMWTKYEDAKAYADRINLRESMESAWVYQLPLDYNYDP